MKSIVNSKYFFPLFLILLTIINVIQGYSTELLADEAYYWAYSNNLSWGYFDHPPMVAIWISISKLFFSDGELSVRFFSSITLTATFYIIWRLVNHPKKREFTWLFVLLLVTTSLFNVYGFITVPDTPLMFFAALFLLGYNKYLEEKSTISYAILALGMAGMLYSKYQGILIIFFVLLSNLKVLKDWKIWVTAVVTVLLFSPHLYWQFVNDFPSIKYHLVERSSKKYRIDFTTNHFLNLIAIIGLTFPIIYMGFYKRFKVKDQFEKALRFIVLGFAIFFFFSSFKNHVQAQWVVPISIPLILIPFYFLIEHPKFLKAFKILATITIVVTIVLRIIIANDGIIPKQFEMHGNKEWVAHLEKELGNKTPLFINSYQNTSTYWFYSGKRPYQINSWDSRKNQYDIYSYNMDFNIENPVLIDFRRKNLTRVTDSVSKKNNGFLFLDSVTGNYSKSSSLWFEFTDEIINLKKNSVNSLHISHEVTDAKLLSHLDLEVVITSTDKQRKIFKANLEEQKVTFSISTLDNFIPSKIQIIGTTLKAVKPIRMSTIGKAKLEN
ncbi:PMT_2 domain-containing protein [Tenacibaculum sp. 190524A05c]|uniref:ArnT family glycosyltransferase n=1 Tax=Tenacibaculum platacis TaxID=3137852 RepID=UPI0031FB6853